MKVITVPNISLREPSNPVDHVTRPLKRLLTELQSTLTHSEIGVGLAAPQIGTKLRVFAVNLPKKSNSEIAEYRYFINPSITKYTQKEALSSRPDGKPDLEGCLSVPHIYAPIMRPIGITMHYDTLQDGQLVHHQENFADFAARVIQHEYDHLDGILFTDHALRQHRPLYYENDDGDLESITLDDLYAIFGGEF